MMKTLIGTKLGMTQITSEDGVVIPVTIISAGPCTVTQVKSAETDGYTAVQLGYGSGKNLSNAVKGQLAKNKLDINPKVLREVRVDELGEVKIGDEVKADIFAIGDVVDVVGTSKGKGFAGTVKRHNFNTSRHTHGGNGVVRKPGSIGSMYPQKVLKGKKMAGQMGAAQTTIKNLKVAFVDAETNIIGLKGAVPGPRRGLVMINGKEMK
ncbi:MAG: 50S ribosomal protein L3 [Candidatus Nomurabacteria bacterium]|nr:50S ribosomal protein L3 [Candidatus Nomurabacteria bacterium]